MIQGQGFWVKLKEPSLCGHEEQSLHKASTFKTAKATFVNSDTSSEKGGRNHITEDTLASKSDRSQSSHEEANGNNAIESQNDLDDIEGEKNGKNWNPRNMEDGSQDTTSEKSHWQ